MYHAVYYPINWTQAGQIFTVQNNLEVDGNFHEQSEGGFAIVLCKMGCEGDSPRPLSLCHMLAISSYG